MDLARPLRVRKFRFHDLVYLEGDAVRHLSLQLQDVTQVALVSPGPQVSVFSRMD